MCDTVPCVNCGTFFMPRSRNQNFCSRKACQSARKAQWERQQRRINPDFRQGRKISQKNLNSKKILKPSTSALGIALERNKVEVETKGSLSAGGGFDSQDLIRFLLDQKTDFIIKHNRRQESKTEWLQAAKEHGHVVRSTTDKTVYQGSVYKHIRDVDDPVRMVFEVTEIHSTDGQLLFAPEVIVFAAWTNLKADEKHILKAYRDRGTSEQYHAEFKSELNMNRLPSGKLSVNSAFLKMGMLVYNMFKIVGQDMVISRSLGLKKATRRRMKTVMNSVIYMCGRIMPDSRCKILEVQEYSIHARIVD